MLRKLAIVLLTAAAMAAVIPGAKAAVPDFAPGQMWSLKDYPAKVVVGKIEPWYDTVVVHVSVLDIPGGIIKHLSFMPIEKPALAASVDKLLATDAKPQPGFSSEYQVWKATPGSGIYSATVPATVELLLRNRSLNRAPTSVGQ